MLPHELTQRNTQHTTGRKFAVFGRRVNGHYEMYPAVKYRHALFGEIVASGGRLYQVCLNAWRPCVLVDVTADLQGGQP